MFSLRNGILISLFVGGFFVMTLPIVSQGREEEQPASCSQALSPEVKTFYTTKVFKFFDWIKNRRYKLTVRGLDQLGEPEEVKSTLFLLAHEGYSDPTIAASVLGRLYGARPLMDEGQFAKPVFGPSLKWLSGKVGILPVPGEASGVVRRRKNLEQLENRVVEALDAGDNIFLYPSGALKKGPREHLGNNSLVESILNRRPGTRVVMGRYQGLWGSIWGWGGQKKLNLAKAVAHSVSALVSNLTFVPKREVTMTFQEATDIPISGGRKALNHYLEAFFNEVDIQRTYVAHSLWDRLRHGSQPKILPELQREVEERGSEGREPYFLKVEKREIIDRLLIETAGIDSFDEESELKDLGLDSMGFATLILALEGEFKVYPDRNKLRTVEDLYRVAAGDSDLLVEKDQNESSEAWRGNPYSEETLLALPEGQSIDEMVIRQAMANPDLVIGEDEVSGSLTYKKLLIGIFIMAEKIKKMPGHNIGIMLPPSVGSLVYYLATKFAGKVPTMVNFSAGNDPVRYSMDDAEVQTIITSSQFLDRLDRLNLKFDSVYDRLVFVEDIGKTISTREKLIAAFNAQFRPQTLLKRKVDPICTILFSSGSEGNPKTIEITQKMMLANLRGVLQHFQINQADSIVNFLPPFHSFGHLVMLISATLGVPTVYFPDGTDGRAISDIIGTYRPTIILGVPTFYQNIYLQTEDATKLESLRLALSGAARLTQAINDLMKGLTPHLEILEGYGVTEASPVITLNKPGDQEHGTVGVPLDNVELLIVDINTKAPVSELGQQGLIVARGDNFMKAYRNQKPNQNPWVEVPGHGQFYSTGDLGYINERGKLVITGRLKRFRKISGEMVSLGALEEALEPLILAKAKEQEIDPEGGFLVVEAPQRDDSPLVLFTPVRVTLEEVNKALQDAGRPRRERMSKVRHEEFIPLIGPGKVDWKIYMRRLTAETDSTE